MSSNFSPGDRLGRYEIKTQLGAGGMGEVYLAQDTKLDRKVALKILPADLAANQDRMISVTGPRIQEDLHMSPEMLRVITRTRTELFGQLSCLAI